MYTRRTLAAAAAALTMGCGPIDINVTSTGAEGSYGSTDGPVAGSTGLGGSESGSVDTGSTTGASLGSESTDSSSAGGSSSSTGEPPAGCLWEPGPPASCLCDGAPSHPTECGCVLSGGVCVCPDDPNDYPAGMCTDDVCISDMITGECFCDSSPADASACDGDCIMVLADDGPTCLCGGIVSDHVACGCFVVPQNGECWCGDCPNGDDCQAWPSETCTTPAPVGECLPGVPCCAVVAGDCVCDGAVAPGEYCECTAIGVLCLCGGVLSPPESC